MLSKGVRLAAGQRVRLPSGLSPSVLLVGGYCVCLVGLLVSLLVGHCVRPVSILYPLSPVLSPFLVVTVSILLPRFRACTAGVRPFPLAMQHVNSFVSKVISSPFHQTVLNAF